MRLSRNLADVVRIADDYAPRVDGDAAFFRDVGRIGRPRCRAHPKPAWACGRVRPVRSAWRDRGGLYLVPLMVLALVPSGLVWGIDARLRRRGRPV
jgi:hypothetical protein